jgi:hypothetical protein
MLFFLALYVATIARWWMSWYDDMRSHPPRGRVGYEDLLATEEVAIISP